MPRTPPPVASPENSGPKQAAGRFRKGISGNPAGKPRGARNRSTLALEALIEGQGKAIVDALVKAAIGGDVSAGRALLDRLVPPRKDRAVKFDLPPISDAAQAAQAMGAILAAVAAGTLVPSEAEAVARIVDTFARTLEIAELEARLADVEARIPT